MESGCDLQVHNQGNLRIGQHVYMNKYCMISAHGLVEIGDNCIFGPSVKLFDNNHRFGKDGAYQELAVGSVKIGNNCWIASNVIILKGANIGDNCIIGAGCIVKGHVPSCSIVRPNTNNIIEEIH
jgi:acetyltransferase-like isoleucine patch superfamily enzyme